VGVTRLKSEDVPFDFITEEDNEVDLDLLPKINKVSWGKRHSEGPTKKDNKFCRDKSRMTAKPQDSMRKSLDDSDIDYLFSHQQIKESDLSQNNHQSDNINIKSNKNRNKRLTITEKCEFAKNDLATKIQMRKQDLIDFYQPSSPKKNNVITPKWINMKDKNRKIKKIDNTVLFGID